MKKHSLLLFVCLLSCTPIAAPGVTPTTSPTTSPTASATMSPTAFATVSPRVPQIFSSTSYPTLLPTGEYLRESLTIDDRCPHFCWLGINPDITSVEEARTLLEASGEIDHINLTETYIEMAWRRDYYIVASFEQGMVKSIYLSTWYTFSDLTLFDFTQFLGEPDEIRIAAYETPHCESISYLIYYASRKMALFVDNGSWNGPNPIDLIAAMTLNTGFEDEAIQKHYLQPLGLNNDYLSDRQPWLGFERLRDYLPERTLPTGPCVLPGAAF